MLFSYFVWVVLNSGRVVGLNDLSYLDSYWNLLPASLGAL